MRHRRTLGSYTRYNGVRAIRYTRKDEAPIETSRDIRVVDPFSARGEIINHLTRGCQE